LATSATCKVEFSSKPSAPPPLPLDIQPLYYAVGLHPYLILGFQQLISHDFDHLIPFCSQFVDFIYCRKIYISKSELVGTYHIVLQKEWIL
jgi:hypothetical protein